LENPACGVDRNRRGYTRKAVSNDLQQKPEEISYGYFAGESQEFLPLNFFWKS
jgi:hypothetical protein